MGDLLASIPLKKVSLLPAVINCIYSLGDGRDPCTPCALSSHGRILAGPVLPGSCTGGNYCSAGFQMAGYGHGILKARMGKGAGQVEFTALGPRRC